MCMQENKAVIPKKGKSATRCKRKRKMCIEKKESMLLRIKKMENH